MVSVPSRGLDPSSGRWFSHCSVRSSGMNRGVIIVVVGIVRCSFGVFILPTLGLNLVNWEQPLIDGPLRRSTSSCIISNILKVLFRLSEELVEGGETRLWSSSTYEL